MQQTGIGHCGWLCLGHQTERVEPLADHRARPSIRRGQAQGATLIIGGEGRPTSPELLAPFGVVKQSGVGREFGVFGLEAFLEAKSIVSD